jgi:hypothetical protein
LCDIVTDDNRIDVYDFFIDQMEDVMTRNVGTLDRIVRTIVGLGLLYLGLLSGFSAFEGTLITSIVVAVGLVMMVVASIGFCPLYTILGFKTCGIK